MHYYDGSFWGMHLIWWIIWMIVLIWIFFIPYGSPKQRSKKEDGDPLLILRKRFAKGEISKEEFEESKKILIAKND
jgi:putative membrane protein